MKTRQTQLRSSSMLSALLVLGALAGMPPGSSAAEILVTAPMAEENRRAAFRKSMRKLWTEHIVWTRAYIVAALAGAPDTLETERRLLKNQAEIGAAFVPYYGEEAGAKLSQLVKEHILIASDVVAALKKKDEAKLRKADKRWHENAVELSVQLNSMNPAWSVEAYVSMFNAHLALTNKLATARLQKRWPEDIAAFDELYAHMMLMADDLAEGVIGQFPEKI